MDLSWLTSADAPDSRDLVGGKAHHLCLLRRWGMPVPRFGVVTTEAYRRWKTHGALDANLTRRMTEEISSWGSTFFAVRSSMTAEDSGTSSYAGVMETYLYVRAQDVAARVVDCFKSADSDRAKAYREARSDSGASGEAAVVVQEMIPSETSGVAFSRAPVGNSALVYIEAGRGLGEGVVSGWVEVDKIWVDRYGSEIKSEIAHKERQVLYVPGTGKTAVVEIPGPARDLPCLNEAQVAELSRAVLDAEIRLGAPADLEWAFAHGKLHVLQVRPITQHFAPLEYYADTNLSESYPGLTSPFTADFVKRMYTVVFTEGFFLLGESKRRMKLLAPYYDRLIGEFEGHLYYRLNSYYVAITALPKGSMSLEDWHRMVGGAVSGGIGIGSVDPHRPWELAQMAWVNLRLFWNRRRVFDGFCRESEDRARKLDQALAASPDSRSTARLLHDTVLGDGTKGWGLTPINDLYVMMGLKFLNRMLEKRGAEPSEMAAYLRTEAGVDSLEPLHWLTRIAGELREIPGFWTALGAACDQKDAPLEALEAKGFAAPVARLREFLTQFGDRAFEELKIECLTFRQDPQGFLRLVRFLGESSQAGHAAAGTRPPAREVRGWWMGKVIGFTREAIQVRERTRLLRGRMYGWVREAMLKLADQLRSEYPAELGQFETRAFFGLRLAQVNEIAEGRWNGSRAADFLSVEGRWHERRREYPEFFCHARDEDSEPSFVLREKGSERAALASESSTDGIYRGTGASPGVVRGEVLAITDPRDAMSAGDLSTRILVTRTTDPAWIFILSRCAGLVSEKGSLLSHTAIVGRELGIPTVVGVSGAMRHLKTGQRVELDGKSGEIRLVEVSETVD